MAGGPDLPARALDFANLHLYEEGTIDDPADTVAAAVSTGRLISRAAAEALDGRPVFDSEHGPIHTFKDRHKTPPEAFDDEYFRHMQWAHLASGGAGGGMRWPNRSPHRLTAGMRRAQRALAGFLPLVDWTRLRRGGLAGRLAVDAPQLAAFGCGDGEQAVLWLLRADSIGPDGMLRADAAPLSVQIELRGLRPGGYAVTFYDTFAGVARATSGAKCSAEAPARFTTPPIRRDLAVAIRRL